MTNVYQPNEDIFYEMFKCQYADPLQTDEKGEQATSQMWQIPKSPRVLEEVANE
jgi:hypothetical protein